MFKKFYSLFFLTVFISILCVTDSYAYLNWRYYSNSKFGYELEYPSEVFYMEEGYDNYTSQRIYFKPQNR